MINQMMGRFGLPDNSPRNSLGVRYDADRYGLDTQTALSRDQWAVYLNTFMPVEDNAIQWATDVRKPAEASDRAQAYVGQAFDQNAGVAERRRRAYGITLTGDEQAAVDRSNNLNESLAKVQAGNASREATMVQQRSLMGGGSAGGLTV